MAGPALAAAPGPGNTKPPVLSQPTDAQTGPTQRAQATAKKTGKPVTIDELTTENTLTVANPDGSLSTTRHLQTARVKKNGKWTPVDATLTKNSDGSFSPAAAASGVTLSGGGTAPLASFTDKAGHKLALSLPFALPTPTVSGDTAGYADVLPGVDLNATVTDQGAFREVLVVHNAQAAANPALKTLRLATSTNGLSTSSDQDGNLTVKAADGKPAFTAPAPVMWDSAAPQATPRANARSADGEIAAPAGPAVAPVAGAGTTGTVDAAGADVSSKDGPGHGAHISKLAVQADDNSITLTPDPAQLASGTYPEYIDPGVAPTAGTSHFTEVRESCSDNIYDKAQTNGEGVGYQHYDTCSGLYRSFFQLDTSALNGSMQIMSSKLYFTETYGADHDCTNGSWPVSLALTGAMNPNNNAWGAQPGVTTNIGSQNVLTAAAGCGGYRTVLFDVTGVVNQWKTNGNLTFGLYGNESKYSTNYGFMRFSTNPYLITTYDIAPNQPTGMYTDPYSGECGSTGWIGMTTLNGNASNINLHAWVSTPMSGTNLKTYFHVWDNMVNNGSGSPADASNPSSDWVASGNWTSANIGGQVSDGHQYGWNATASDGTLGSPGSQYCYFNVDLSPPSLASFTPSTTFPPLGSGITPNAHAGDTGITIPVTSTDPTPGGCNLQACIKSGVAAFQYSLDTNIPVSGASSVQVTSDANGTATANIPINLTASQWGTHTLFVRAVDGAGNTQATAAAYSFYAPWNPNAKVTAGDLTGDAVPDTIVADPTGSGNLTLVPGGKDPDATPLVASTPANSPDGTSWDNYLVTHRGSQSQMMVDDIFAYQKNTKTLYLYRNDGITSGGANGYFTNTANVSTPIGKPAICLSSDCSGYNGTDWSGLTQLVAPGQFSGTKGYADLITVENGKLWYYPGSAKPSTYLGKPYLIGSGDWSNTTLIAPGVTGANVSSGTSTGGTPTLWARNNVTGAISSYPLTFDPATGAPTSNLTAPTFSNLNPAGSALCVDMTGGTDANGTLAELWNCGSTPWENQSFTWGADGSLHVMGKCLDDQNGYVTDGNPVQLYDCNNTDAQHWTSVAGSPGLLKNVKANLCLSAPKGNLTASVKLIVTACTAGAAEQTWSADGAALTQQTVLNLGVRAATYPVITSPGDVNGDGNPDLLTITGGTGGGVMTEYQGIAPSGTLPLLGGATPMGTVDAPVQTDVRSAYDGKCLDNYGGTNGTPVAQYDCWGGAGQKFSFATDGTLRSGGKCVSTANAGTGNGTSVISWDCQPGHAEQQWVLRGDGSIYNPASQRCLELPGWTTVNGGSLDIWDCIGGHANQLWTVRTY
ncbi:ricin-type beta-trefoil lectin domain protein [Kitasatospora azatica]|uniref:ricin-type beta-trefoil lectin domain protein n=1 Tax=Kitasatospora azatica TaxID=58347 RepID=UPI00055A5884|nr:ricin-type beta-trefoil lectin domain protein [Kitasatospora azatica]